MREENPAVDRAVDETHIMRIQDEPHYVPKERKKMNGCSYKEEK